MGKPVYVVDIDADSKRVVIGDNDRLLTAGLVAGSMNGLGNHKKGSRYWLGFATVCSPYV